MQHQHQQKQQQHQHTYAMLAAAQQQSQQQQALLQQQHLQQQQQQNQQGVPSPLSPATVMIGTPENMMHPQSPSSTMMGQGLSIRGSWSSSSPFSSSRSSRKSTPTVAMIVVGTSKGILFWRARKNSWPRIRIA
jgi:type II secretory pathway pseudopilin PulG